MLTVSIIMLTASGFYIKGTSYLGGGTGNLSTIFTCLIFLQASVPNWQSPNCINVIWMSCFCLSAHSSPRTKEHFVKLTPSHKKYLGPSFLSGAWRYFMHGLRLLFFGRAYPRVSGQMDPNSMNSQTGRRIARSTSLPFPSEQKAAKARWVKRFTRKIPPAYGRLWDLPALLARFVSPPSVEVRDKKLLWKRSYTNQAPKMTSSWKK